MPSHGVLPRAETAQHADRAWLPGVSGVQTDRRVARAMTFIVQDLSRRPSRAEAALVACLDPAYFSKRFLKSTGVNFSVWNRQIRVEAAKRLLLGSDFQIGQVAAAVGYDDLTTFERNFLRQTGVRPREYRT